jgi:chemotaxis signal transduction protein
MSRLTKYMPAVVGYRERLATLQGAWDSLALLSHLSDDGTNLSGTRQAFESLAADLVTHLAAETHKKALLAAKARAQVAIDILVRNLFERTADIGFLAEDDAIRRYAREALPLRRQASEPGSEADAAARTLAAATRSLQHRLAEYVAKYSVYHNVILISPEGEVLLQLEGARAPPITRDPLVATTLSTDRAYVETFRRSDLVPDARRALIYSQPVTSDHQTLGVLCLCFRLEDECDGIFAKLRGDADWTVLSLLDAQGEVIATSDAYQLPVGARVAAGNAETGDVVRFAGREFLAVTRTAQPYQGYAGPAWRGHVMVPLERAFETQENGEQLSCTPETLADLRASAATFSTALREIPHQADAVQRDLNRSVWNGSVRLSLGDGSNGTFAKALLREITNMGRKTKEVFERSIEELHETVVSSVLHDSRFLASLAVELLARNLYERANDCRWWALDATLIGRLAGVEGCNDDAATRVLRHINQLYTGYHCIVLFDAERHVVATSRTEYEHFIGTSIEEPWAAQTLALSGSQAYSVSEFRPSVFYNNQSTLIYGAAIRSSYGQLVGGVAVVFDTTPQLAAMLRDALPRDERGNPIAGCAAAFLDRQLRVICATDPSFEAADSAIEWVKSSALHGEARVVRIGEIYHAVGTKPDTGYREYTGLGGYAVVLMPIGKVPQQRVGSRGGHPHRASARHDNIKQDALEFATFASGNNWYALPTSDVVEAIDARTLQSLPTGETWCAGFVMFAGEPIVVADMARLLGVTSLETPCVVIVIRTQGRRQPFGILVEMLGDIPEVPPERLLPIGGLRNQPSGLVEHAIEPADPSDPLVMILSTPRLVALMQGAPMADVAA